MATYQPLRSFTGGKIIPGEVISSTQTKHARATPVRSYKWESEQPRLLIDPPSRTVPGTTPESRTAGRRARATKITDAPSRTYQRAERAGRAARLYGPPAVGGAGVILAASAVGRGEQYQDGVKLRQKEDRAAAAKARRRAKRAAQKQQLAKADEGKQRRAVTIGTNTAAGGYLGYRGAQMVRLANRAEREGIPAAFKARDHNVKAWAQRKQRADQAERAMKETPVDGLGSRWTRVNAFHRAQADEAKAARAAKHVNDEITRARKQVKNVRRVGAAIIGGGAALPVAGVMLANSHKRGYEAEAAKTQQPTTNSKIPSAARRGRRVEA